MVSFRGLIFDPCHLNAVVAPGAAPPTRGTAFTSFGTPVKKRFFVFISGLMTLINSIVDIKGHTSKEGYCTLVNYSSMTGIRDETET
jgi:hypothetical protein